VIPEEKSSDMEDFWLYSNSIFMVMALGWHFSVYASERGIDVTNVIDTFQKKVAKAAITGKYDNKSSDEAIDEVLEESAKEANGNSKITKADREVTRHLFKKVVNIYAYWLVENGKAKAQELEKDMKSNTFVF